MKKGVICFGVFLALFTTVFVSLNASSDVSALKHQYVGLPILSRFVGIVKEGENGTYYIDKNLESNETSGVLIIHDNLWTLSLTGQSYLSDYDSFKMNSNLSYIGTSLNNSGDCQFSGRLYSLVNRYFYSTNYGDRNDGVRYTIGRSLDVPIYEPGTYPVTSPLSCRNQSPFGSNFTPRFDAGSVSALQGYLTCGVSNGAKCDGIWWQSDYINNEILPYSYTTDLVYLNKSVQSVDGTVYNNNFSFNQIFKGDNSYIPKFHYLKIPLNDFEYFTDSSNLYATRPFDFSGSFMFKGSFQWGQGFEQSGNFHIHLSGTDTQGRGQTQDVPCNLNFIDVPGADYRELTYSCPLTLEHNYLSINVYLEIVGFENNSVNNSNQPVWITDDEWYFNGSFLTTDNDDTPGEPFNTTATGGSSAPGTPYVPSDSAGTVDEFFNKLTELFSFSFANPFAPLLSMFTDGGSCASIPTLAGMLHSEETTVCPWFDSNTRNIVTPVLSIASMMLIFGFAVRWLGASSGNLFEDSAKIEPPGTSVMNGTVSSHGWRRRK